MLRCLLLLFFFFKQKTAYEMRISDWSSDVCSSDLAKVPGRGHFRGLKARRQAKGIRWRPPDHDQSRSSETRCCIPDGETDNGRSLNLSEISSDRKSVV